MDNYLTIENDYVVLETVEGCTMPTSYTFEAINNYVHGIDVHFEDLVALCLGMANHIEKLEKPSTQLEDAKESE